MTACNLPPATSPYNTAAFTTPESNPTRHKRGIATPDKLWPQHSVLKIALLDMTDAQKTLVKANIRKWTPHTNLHFKFVDTAQGDIRITANNTSTAGWSYVGTDAKNASPSEPTMSIGFGSSPERIEAQVVHEFGHALGLRHEHQHPDRTLVFDDDEVYKDYESRNKTRGEAYHDILRKSHRSAVKTSPYDEKSIMHYSFSRPRLKSPSEIPKPLQLSEGDKHFIQSLYPQDSTPVGQLIYTLMKVLIKADRPPTA
ncbi:M12 family metallopeptidase [Pseudomonas fluorescens]|uniref:Peptidase metallopeptidase domain-containing protein n=1 Tax=Pseudomonas fluorescens TaxID=294 RepID=A0A7Z6QQQ5_PSEFL|nr:M57 family metalloprotease [Pseudomonas fluorescens]RDS92225.1 hypothetical protein DL347_03410 [Pseudomonas fluorescens]